MKRATLTKVAIPAALLSAGILLRPMATTAEAMVQGGPPPVGGPLPGLSQNEQQRFGAGRNEFNRIFQIGDGLGPVFNGTSCFQCHRAGAPGGASADLGVSVVTRFGANVNGQYSDLPNLGGALIQARSLREFIANYPVPREVVPAQAQFISRRITTPIFGMGLIEAIPEAQIRALADPNDLTKDGISGRVAEVFNPETNRTEVGRFGWKCQVSSTHIFAGDAYLNEMGITSPTFSMEVRPQGNSIPAGADTVADPEDFNGARTNRVTDFMRFTASPAGALGTIQQRALFQKVGCAGCHTPSMTTGPNPVAGLSNQTVNLYSDLLVHDMGPALADGVVQGQASGSEWRTAPLWGLRFRPFLLHDGRARSIDEAIRLHGGEATRSVKTYNALSSTERATLLSFLQGL